MVQYSTGTRVPGYGLEDGHVMAADIVSVQAKEAFNTRQRQLVVTFINGDELCASMGRSAMVPDLKRHISSKYGTPFGLQELFIVGSNIERRRDQGWAQRLCNDIQLHEQKK